MITSRSDMVIIETCPECGHDLRSVMLTSNPPIHQRYCPHCGWSWMENPSREVVRVPFNPYGSFDQSVPPACRGCANHPSNGGSGICWCINGLMQVTC